MRKKVLVLGGTGGVGEQIIKKLSSDFDVYAIYKNNHEKAEELKSLAAVIQCDVRDYQQVLKLKERLTDIAVIVNALTPKIILKKFQDSSEEEFNENIDVMIKGSANVYRALMGNLSKDKPLVIAFSSITAVEKPVARMCSYAVAKAGLSKLHDYLIDELKNTNIRVVNLIPSFIETQALRVFPNKLLEIQKAALPGNEFIQPKDLAELVLRIINNEAKYPHGTQFVLNNNIEVQRG